MKITKRKSLFSKITGFERFRKKPEGLELAERLVGLEEEDTPLSKQKMIVKTISPDYVPEGLEVVARIDEFLFTASIPEMTMEQLKLLDADPDIASVMLAERLRMISELPDDLV